MQRLVDFLRSASPESAPRLGDIMLRGLSLLREHPMIGRKVDDRYRELVISHGRSGYLALYRYDPSEDLVLVLAIRHQREQGYEHDVAQ